MPRTSSKKVASYEVRRSPVDGTGLFATRPVAKGEKIIEYLGERISHEEADRRHELKAKGDHHTFFFTIDAKTVVDAGVRGNEARFINHGCDPNCEVVVADGVLIVEAVRNIRAGEELAYEYNLSRDPDDPPDVEKLYACRCGAATCRGTMLTPRKQPKPSAKAKTKAKAKAKARARA